jgi:hypothetical protein
MISIRQKSGQEKESVIECAITIVKPHEQLARAAQ